MAIALRSQVNHIVGDFYYYFVNGRCTKFDFRLLRREFGLLPYLWNSFLAMPQNNKTTSGRTTWIWKAESTYKFKPIPSTGAMEPGVDWI